MESKFTANRDCVIQALQQTISSVDRIKDATEYLENFQKLDGAGPTLLQIVMDEQIPSAVRQAAVIHLKNLINRSWISEEADAEQSFFLSDNDKEFLRANFLDAIVCAPEVLRVQLCYAIGSILRHDYPLYWGDLLTKIYSLLQSNDGQSWLGALLVLRRLVKLFEYRKANEKREIIKVLPMLFERLIALMSDQSQESCLLQKIILKIFHCSVHFTLNLNVLSLEMYDLWFEQLRIVIERPIPVDLSALNEFDRGRTVWWKCKKWAAVTLHRVFERYGLTHRSARNAKSAKTRKFVENFRAKHAERILHTVLAELSKYKAGEYIAPRVLNHMFDYISTAIGRSETWAVVQPHCYDLIISVLFPLFKFTDDDEELWNDSQVEYIRMKYDIYNEMQDPINGATCIIFALLERKHVLEGIFDFLVQVLRSPDFDARSKDGALRMTAEISTKIMKHKDCKSHVGEFLTTVILPFVSCSVPFLRARACSTISEFAIGKLNVDIVRSIEETLVSRLSDPDETIPVKIEAAIALNNFITERHLIFIKAHLSIIVLETLRLLVLTEMEQLVDVIDNIFEEFSRNDLSIIAVDAVTQMTSVFLKMTSEDLDDDRMVSASGIISAMATVLNNMFDDSMQYQMEVEIRKIIKVVLEKQLTAYYDYLIPLIRNLIRKAVSEPMWELYFGLSQLLDDCSLSFTEIAPILHLYLSVDTDSFLAIPERRLTMIAIAERILNDENAAVREMEHAAKLLECLVLYCQGAINELIPQILQIVINKLLKISESSDWNDHEPCIFVLYQTAAACIYYDADHFLDFVSYLEPLRSETFQFLINGFGNVCQLPAPEARRWHGRNVFALALGSLLGLFPRKRLILDQLALPLNKMVLGLLNELSIILHPSLESAMKDGSKDDGFKNVDDSSESISLSNDSDEVSNSENDFYLRNDDADSDDGATMNWSDADSLTSDLSESVSFLCYLNPIDTDILLDPFLVYARSIEAIRASGDDCFEKITDQGNNGVITEMNHMLEVCNTRRKFVGSVVVGESGGYSFKANVVVPTSFNFSSSS